jgi:cleavage stimulation factor subunit 3
VDALYNRSLRTLVTVDLWKSYLDYIKQNQMGNMADPDRRVEARAVIMKAFELAVGSVGLDRESGLIWMDYLAFIRAGEVFLFLFLLTRY